MALTAARCAFDETCPGAAEAERLSAWAAQYIDQIDGDAQARDRRGRDLPDWQGCQTVAAGDVFLMNPGFPDCLDGRYFGPLPASSIVGQAVPLWTDEGDGGRFVWRAATH